MYFLVLLRQQELVGTTIKKYCAINQHESELLTSRQRPIVIVKNASEVLSPEISPGQNTMGIMLPYTPLHYLLLEPEKDFPEILVMTSGNFSEEPIATGNEEALEKLDPLADGFLLNDRDIHMRCDDSVVRSFNQQLYPIRRSRGYAPHPILLKWQSPPILAAGAELKNTFCLAKDQYAFLSHHIGNLENYETLESFETGIEHFESLFRIRPELIAYDLHPDYLASRYALARAAEEELPALGVQHHHAHIAACLAEHQHPGDRPVIGVAFDGTGFGTDHTIWGGEFLIADYQSFQRAYYLSPFPLPGGDSATKQPWKVALALLHNNQLNPHEKIESLQEIPIDQRELLHQQLEKTINAPLTSSMGRLFDGIAALAGIRQIVNYEAQSAIELEAIADPTTEAFYAFSYNENCFTPQPLLSEILSDIQNGQPKGTISAKFHNGVAQMVNQVCLNLRKEYQLEEVVLSGGVWQNIYLLSKTLPLLEKSGFIVYIHNNIPANDGGLALGQAAIAYHSQK